MTVEHSTLTDPDIHEPKGASSASANSAYIADGSGSGSWTVIRNLNKIYLSTQIADVSTAGSHWLVIPATGTISKIYSVIHGALGTADAGLTFEINGTAITGGAITIAYTSSAAGDVDSASPTANNTITAGTAVEIITDGASSNTVVCTLTFEVTLT